MISLTSDIADLILRRTLSESTWGLNHTINRLTTGYKVNRAKDNAAGYSIITDLSTRINSMLQIQNNTEHGIALLQTAEGGLEEISGLLKKLREITIQAADDSYDSKSRQAMQAEADELMLAIDKIQNSIEYDGQNLYGSTVVVDTVATTNNYNSNSNGADILNSFTLNAPSIQATEADSSASVASFSFDSVQPIMRSTTPLSVVEEGTVNFATGETKTITIDGVEYTVTNNQSGVNTLSYSKDSSGKITFICNYFTIKCQTNVAHNIHIKGNELEIIGGDLADNISIEEISIYRNNYIYGGKGDDILTGRILNSATTQFIYGEDGNDTISGNGYLYGGNDDDIINAYNYTRTSDGGDGNDTINIQASSIAYIHNGGEGDDHFYVASGAENAVINGGSGSNTIEDNGTNTIKANVVGANAYIEKFSAKETKTLTINNIQYEITNRNSFEVDFIWQINDNCINFLSEYFTIKGQLDKSHNVKLSGRVIYFYGGNLDDNIILNKAECRIYSLDGNDTITSAMSEAGYSYINTGSGNDNLIDTFGGFRASAIYMGEGDDVVEIGNVNNVYLDLGNGNNSITTSSKFNNSAIIGGTGNDTYSGANIEEKNIQLYGIENGNTTLQYYETLNSGETKEVTINGKTYTIKSNKDVDTSFAYGYNEVTGEVYIAGAYLQINAQDNVEHNVKLYGRTNYFYGGSKGDTVTSYTYNSYLYGNDGNDILTIYSSDSTVYGNNGDDTIISYAYASLNGGEGNDKIVTNTNTTYNINGGNGNDSYEVNASVNITDTGGDNVYYINTNNTNITGSDGNDTFYIKGDNNTVSGGSGNDYFEITGTGSNTIDGGTGTNYYIDNSSGTTTTTNAIEDPYAKILNFTAQGEIQTLVIEGKSYTVKNNGTVNKLKASYNPNTQIYTIIGSDFEVTSASNQNNNLQILGSNVIYNGSELIDKINIVSGTNNVINTYAGNDIIEMNTENNSINSGDGNDSIILNATSTEEINAGAGNDSIDINSSGNTNINAGLGNDTLIANGNNNTIELSSGDNNITVKGSDNTITSQDGNNTINIQKNSNNITLGNGNNNIIIGAENNTIELGNGDNKSSILADNNDITVTGGTYKAKVKGNSNIITSNANSYIEYTGNNNTFIGENNKSEITFKGDSNEFYGSVENDTIIIEAGNNNIIDGAGGNRNIVIDYGNNTQITNAVVAQQKPFELNLKVGLGSKDSSYISTEINFDSFKLNIDLSTRESALESLKSIDDLIENVNSQLLNIGTVVNRLLTVQEEQSIILENLLSTRSTLRDADIAEESSNYIRYQILQQASATLLSSYRNLRVENVLGLLNFKIK